MMKAADIVLFFLATVGAGDPNQAALTQLVVDKDASQPLFGSAVSGGKALEYDDNVIDSWTDPWDEATGRSLRSFLETLIPTGLRGSAYDNETEVILEDEKGLISDEENSRRLQYSTNVEIFNNCGKDAKAFVVYFRHGTTRIKRWSEITNGGTLMLEGMTDPTFYLFGMTMEHKWLWVGPSPYCLGGKHSKQCLRKVELGSLRGGNVQFKPCSPRQPSPGTEEHTWLEAHNSRRTDFFAQNDMGPMDLKWAPSLARSAQSYANKLASVRGCHIAHFHEGDVYGGENLYANWGSGKYAKPRSVDGVLKAWYDDEINLSFLGLKYHATQVVFRSSRYIGCASVEKDMETKEGYKCYILVCRYIATGNCFEDLNKWKESVLSDDVAGRCNGDQCSSLDEGCFT